MKKLAILMILAAALALSCGSEEEETTGKISGTISYNGVNQGTLGIAAFASLPPMSAPDGMALVTNPVFPQAYEIENLPSGSYYIYAYMDVGGNNLTMPGAEDPVSAFTAAIEVAGGETTAGVDLTLVDP